MKNNLEIFRREFLNANTWAQRKDGIPLYLLDKLSNEERKVAESELIAALSTGDTWPIMGLGHIKSTAALPTLYSLLSKTFKQIKVTLAHAIFQICADPLMIDISLDEMAQLSQWHELIDLLYLLPDFRNKRTDQLLQDFRNHPEYLVAYNATRALGLPTGPVVQKFRRKSE